MLTVLLFNLDHVGDSHGHVNLVDLVDYGTSEGRSPPPTIFGTLIGLRVYTKTTRKVFPQGRAEDTLLKFFAAACFLSSWTSPARVNVC
jgi:hypothetical protein